MTTHSDHVANLKEMVVERLKRKGVTDTNIVNPILSWAEQGQLLMCPEVFEDTLSGVINDAADYHG